MCSHEFDRSAEATPPDYEQPCSEHFQEVAVCCVSFCDCNHDVVAALFIKCFHHCSHLVRVNHGTPLERFCHGGVALVLVHPYMDHDVRLFLLFYEVVHYCVLDDRLCCVRCH